MMEQTALPMMSQRTNSIIFTCWGLGILGLDQATKFWAETCLSNQTIHLCGWFRFALAHNTGGSWGIFHNHAFLLATLGLLGMGVIFWKRHVLGIGQQPIILGLLLGGISGNTLDRFFRGFVVDFIDVDLWTYHWPTFNVADSALCIAVGVLLIVSVVKK